METMAILLIFTGYAPCTLNDKSFLMGTSLLMVAMLAACGYKLHSISQASPMPEAPAAASFVHKALN
jgi:hypothetical protein